MTSKDINVNGKKCDLPEKQFEFLIKYEKLYAEGIDFRYEDYRDINQKGKADYNNKKLIMLPIQKNLSMLIFKKTQMVFEAKRGVVEVGADQVGVDDPHVLRKAIAAESREGSSGHVRR